MSERLENVQKLRSNRNKRKREAYRLSEDPRCVRSSWYEPFCLDEEKQGGKGAIVEEISQTFQKNRRNGRRVKMNSEGHYL